MSTTYTRPSATVGAGEAHGEALGAPERRRLRDVAGALAVDGHDRAHGAAVRVLLAVGGVDDVAVHHRRAVEAAHAELVPPHRRARARIDRVEPAVGAAADDQAPAADDGHRRAGLVVGVVERALRRASRSSARRPCACRRPCSAGAAGRCRPSPRPPRRPRRGLHPPAGSACGRRSRSRGRTPRPAGAAIPSCPCGRGDELAVHVLGEDVARLRVAGERRPAHAREGHGGVVDGEAALPQPLARPRVEAGDQLVALGPAPPRPLVQTRPSNTRGVARAVRSAFQSRFSPVAWTRSRQGPSRRTPWAVRAAPVGAEPRRRRARDEEDLKRKRRPGHRQSAPVLRPKRYSGLRGRSVDEVKQKDPDATARRGGGRRAGDPRRPRGRGRGRDEVKGSVFTVEVHSRERGSQERPRQRLPGLRGGPRGYELSRGRLLRGGARTEPYPRPERETGSSRPACSASTS